MKLNDMQQQQQQPQQQQSHQQIPKRTYGRTTEPLNFPKSRSSVEKARDLGANVSRNNRGDEITLKQGGRSLLNDSKILAEEDVKIGDTLKFTQRPADWKHRTVSIKFKVGKGRSASVT